MALVTAVLWGVELVDQYALHSALDQFGVRPLNVEHLGGIVAAPLLHGGLEHLASNTVGILILGTMVAMWSRREFWLVTLAATIVGGLGTWLIGNPASTHIGASGVLFGFFGYLLLRGVFERKIGAILVSLAVGWVFGSNMLHGMLPEQAGAMISWEMHLFGFLGGVLMAWRWRRRWTRSPATKSRR